MTKTRYTNYKTYKTEAGAQALMNKLQKQFPDKTFRVKRRKFIGKLKVRFTVQSV